MFHTSTIVSSMCIKGMTSCRAVDNATYSASHIDKATKDWSLLAHMMGQLLYMMT
jgi:hypothetical protein